MPEKSLNEVSRAWREQYEKGVTAFQRQNYEYAISILTQVLVKEPAFYDCRQALRASQFKKAGDGGGFFKKMLGSASSSPLVAKAQMASRNNPLEAIQICEQILSSDPNSSSAHKILAEAAMASDFPRTAILSLEILVKNSPKDKGLSVQLADAYAHAGQTARAEEMYVELLRADPHNPELAQSLKNLSAQKTMTEGGYEALADGSGSYRDILKNKEEAVALEQESRQVKSGDVADRLILDYEARLQQSPNDLKLLRSVAELQVQKKDFDSALATYARIQEIAGASDPSLEKAITDTTLRRFEAQLSALDAQLPEHAAETERISAERDAFLLDQAKTRAQKYPNDLQIAFDLGQLYFRAGKVGEAIQEFQRAQNHPNRRVQSMSYLGQCFARRGMNDLAARTLQNALKEKPNFDDEKKEIVYALGSVLEKMGKAEEAIEYFKQIYEIDIGYRDVSAKVDAYYAGR